MIEPSSNFVDIDGVRTHYLEAGQGPELVLLHSGEFGACAELSWERNIGALAEHFHVLAPDWLGYGKTEKLFSFDNMRVRRERHIAGFLRAKGVARAHFVGNSMGATMLLAAAARVPPIWPMDRIVVVSGGGDVPDNAARHVLMEYDCTREHMRAIIETMFVSPEIHADEAYLDRRFALSIEPGAWECTAASRFKAPHRTSATSGVRQSGVDYSTVAVPVLLVTGSRDPLREPGFGERMRGEVPGSELLVIQDAGHCPQIERPDIFNPAVIEFLTRNGEGAQRARATAGAA